MNRTAGVVQGHPSIDADGEHMATGRQRSGRAGPDRAHRPVWRRLACSTVTTAAIAALFTPLPAAAAPGVLTAPGVLAAPAGSAPAAVPDSGSRPVPTGALVLPGQTTPVTPVSTAIPGVSLTPLLAKIEKRRAQVALLGERLLKLGEERDIAQGRATVARTQQELARQAVDAAELEVHAAATAALKSAAAMPPGAVGSDLLGLDDLARIQRGEQAGERAAARQLALVQDAAEAADAEVLTATKRAADLSAQYAKLATEHRQQQQALTKLEERNAADLAAEEAAEAARNQELGAGYTGSIDGKGADPRARAAVRYAVAQVGDWYLWAAEGPDRFDCSGLMWAAYRTSAAGSYNLPRVSKDQYYATRDRTVDRYSLLPGDLLFFSSSNSWTGIHHVAMYVGDGKMVEAPRRNVQVRVVPVRWNRLFQATRVYGAVDAPTTPPPVSVPTAPDAKPVPTKPTTPAPAPTKPKPTNPGPTTPTGPPTKPTNPGPTTTPTDPGPTKPTDPTPSTSPTGGTADPSPSKSGAAPTKTGAAPTKTGAGPTRTTSAAPSKTGAATRTSAAATRTRSATVSPSPTTKGR
jgi:cell wall-associated NlpC family hydrolase